MIAHHHILKGDYWDQIHFNVYYFKMMINTQPKHVG